MDPAVSPPQPQIPPGAPIPPCRRSPAALRPQSVSSFPRPQFPPFRVRSHRTPLFEAAPSPPPPPPLGPSGAAAVPHPAALSCGPAGWRPPLRCERMADNSSVGCRTSEPPVGAAEPAALRPQRCPTLGNPPRPVGEFSIQPGRGSQTHPTAASELIWGTSPRFPPLPWAALCTETPRTSHEGWRRRFCPSRCARGSLPPAGVTDEGGAVWGWGTDTLCRLPPLTGPDSHRAMIHEPTSIRPARNSGRTGAGREREQARKAGAERSGAMPGWASGLRSEQGCCEDDDGERAAPAEVSECWLMGIKAGSGRTPTSVGPSLISAELCDGAD